LEVLANEGIFTRDLKKLRGMHSNAVKVSHASTKSGDGETALLTWWDLATT
jgi:hypothetical protein